MSSEHQSAYRRIVQAMPDLTNTQPITRVPSCCYKGSEYIRWREPDLTRGPDKEGWAITMAAEGYGDVDIFRENIMTCPWCGKRLA